MEDTKIVLHQGSVFDALYDIHVHGGHYNVGPAKLYAEVATVHTLLTTFICYGQVQNKYGNGCTRDICTMFCSLCMQCFRNKTGKTATAQAGHTPIVTAGYGVRGTVDLVDMRALAADNDDYHYILTYQVITPLFVILTLTLTLLSLPYPFLDAIPSSSLPYPTLCP